MNCPKCTAILIQSSGNGKMICPMSCGWIASDMPSEDAIKHADNRQPLIPKTDKRRKENKPHKERKEEKKAIKRAKMEQPEEIRTKDQEEVDKSRIAPELLTRKSKTDGRCKYPMYSKEDKNLIVLACEVQGIPEVSKQTGIQITTVCNWRKEAGFHGHTQNTLKSQSEKRIEKASAAITKEDKETQLREESRQRFNKRQTKPEDEAVEVPMLILGLLEYMPKEGEVISITRLDAFGDAFRGILKVIYLK